MLKYIHSLHNNIVKMIAVIIVLIIMIIAIMAGGGYYIYTQQKSTAKILDDALVATIESEKKIQDQLNAEREARELSEHEADLENQALLATNEADRKRLEDEIALAKQETADANAAAEQAAIDAEIATREAEEAAAAAAIESERLRRKAIDDAQKSASDHTTSSRALADAAIQNGAVATRQDIANNGTALAITTQYDIAILALIFKDRLESDRPSLKYAYVKGNIIDGNTVDFQMNVFSSTTQERVDAVRVDFAHKSDYRVDVQRMGTTGSGLTVLPDITSQYGPEQLYPKAWGYFRNSSEYPVTALGQHTYRAGKAIDSLTVDYQFSVPYRLNTGGTSATLNNRRFVLSRNSDGSYNIVSMGANGSGTAGTTPTDYSDITGRYPCSSTTIHGIVTNYWVGKNPGRAVSITQAAAVSKTQCDFLLEVKEGARILAYETRRFTYDWNATTSVKVISMGADGSGLMVTKPNQTILTSNYTPHTNDVLFSVYASRTSRRYPKTVGYNGIVSAGNWATPTLANDATTCAKWKIESDGNGAFYIKNGPTYYLQAGSDFYIRGNSKKTTDDFKWRISANSSGKYAIQNVKYGNFLAIDYARLPGKTINTYFLSIKNINPIYTWSEWKVVSLAENPDATPKASTMTSDSFTINPSTDYIIGSGSDKYLYATSSTSISRGTPSTYTDVYKWQFIPVPNQLNTYMIKNKAGKYIDKNATGRIVTNPTQDYAWEVALQSGEYVFRNRATQKYMAPSNIMTTSTNIYKFRILEPPTIPTTVGGGVHTINSDAIFRFYMGTDKSKVIAKGNNGTVILGSSSEIKYTSNNVIFGSVTPYNFKFVPVAGSDETYMIYATGSRTKSYLYQMISTDASLNGRIASSSSNRPSNKWILEYKGSAGWYWFKNAQTGRYLGSISSTSTAWTTTSKTNTNAINIDNRSSLPTLNVVAGAADTTSGAVSTNTEIIYNNSNTDGVTFRIHDGSGKSFYVNSTGIVGTSSTLPLDEYDFTIEIVAPTQSNYQYNGDIVRFKHIKTGYYLRGSFSSRGSANGIRTINPTNSSFSLNNNYIKWYLKPKSYPKGYRIMNVGGGNKGFLGFNQYGNTYLGATEKVVQLEGKKSAEHFQTGLAISDKYTRYERFQSTPIAESSKLLSILY